ANVWARAVEATRCGGALYRCDVQTTAKPVERAPGAFDDYAAVFLYSLRQPDDKLWVVLADYVGKGGGLGVIPGDAAMNLAAYNDVKAAQDLLPARFEQVVAAPKGGWVDWDWGDKIIYQHPLMHPYNEWRQNKWDFFV